MNFVGSFPSPVSRFFIADQEVPRGKRGGLLSPLFLDKNYCTLFSHVYENWINSVHGHVALDNIEHARDADTILVLYLNQA